MVKTDWCAYKNVDFSERSEVIKDLSERGYTFCEPLDEFNNRDPFVETPSGKRIFHKDVEKGLEKLSFGNPEQIELIKASQLLALRPATWEAEYVVNEDSDKIKNLNLFSQ